jgi:hypothetical protein
MTRLSLTLVAVFLTACYSTDKLEGEAPLCRAECYDNDPCTEDSCDIDDNCLHALIPGCNDADFDGFQAEPFGPDCDDSDPTINPGALEICDELDNDCDRAVDNITEIVIGDELTRIVGNTICLDACCPDDSVEFYPPGMVAEYDLTGVDFASYNAYGVAVRVNTEHIYLSATAESDAKIDYHLWYETLEFPSIGSAGSPFRTPQADIGCDDLDSAVFEPRLRQFTTTPGIGVYPTSIAIWVPECGDDRVALRGPKIQIFMTCSSEQDFPPIPGEEE